MADVILIHYQVEKVKMRFDFKYIVSLIIAILGVSLTIWYANVPKSEKSISLNVLSKSLLYAIDDSDIEGLKITIDENVIDKPALTALTIVNNGTIPIRSSDFESKLEILLHGVDQVFRASIVKTEPKWIKASVELEGNNVALNPVLLNPDDSVTLNILSEGLPSSIETMSRVAGVKFIKIVDSEESEKNIVLPILQLAAAFIVAIPLMALYGPTISIPKRSVELGRKTWIAVVLILMLTAQFLLRYGVEGVFGFDSFWVLLVSTVVLLILALPFGILLNREKIGNKYNQ